MHFLVGRVSTTLLAALLFFVGALDPAHAGGAPAHRGAARRAQDAREAEARPPRWPSAARIAREMHDVLAHSLSGAGDPARGRPAAGRRPRAPTRSVVARARARPPPRARAGWPRRAGDRGAARRRPARARGPRRRSSTRFARARLDVATRRREPRDARARGAARALPRRPGGADQRAPPRAPPSASRCALNYERRRHALDGRGPRRRRARRRRSPAGRGYGLTGMRERAELLGGRLHAGPDRRRLPRRALAAGRRRSASCVADDQRVVREGLGCCSACSTGIEVVGTAATARRRSRSPREHDPDVVLMDLRMPRARRRRGHPRGSAERGDRTARRSRSRPTPTTRSVLGALRAGARGYLTKDAGAEEIARGDRAPSRAARRALDPAVQHHVSRALGRRRAGAPAAPDLPDGLTPREAEVLALIADGLSNAEIAERLVVSARHGEDATSTTSSPRSARATAPRRSATPTARGSPPRHPPRTNAHPAHDGVTLTDQSIWSLARSRPWSISR